MNDPWVLILILFFTIMGCVIITMLVKVLTVLDILNRNIQWGSPRIQERRPAPSGNHRSTQEIG